MPRTSPSFILAAVFLLFVSSAAQPAAPATRPAASIPTTQPALESWTYDVSFLLTELADADKESADRLHALIAALGTVLSMFNESCAAPQDQISGINVNSFRPTITASPQTHAQIQSLLHYLRHRRGLPDQQPVQVPLPTHP